MGRRRVFEQAIPESCNQVGIGTNLIDAAYRRVDGALIRDHLPPVLDPAVTIHHQYPVELGAHQYLILRVYLKSACASILVVVDMSNMLSDVPVGETCE